MSRLHLEINGRFVTQNITGVQRYAREVVLAFDRLKGEDAPELRDVDITLLTPPDGIRNPVPLNHIHQRTIGTRSGHGWEQWDLPANLKGDILFCPGNLAPISALLRRHPVITTVHDLSYRYFPSAYSYGFRALYNLLMPIILHRSAALITVSHAERKEILKHYPRVAERLHAVANGGLPYGAPTTSDPQSRAEPYFLYTGALSARKNFPAVLTAAISVLEHKDARLIVVGQSNGTFRDLELEIPEKLRPRIEFVGQVDSLETLISLYKGALALVFPSRYESSGLPPIEAMACGCPVIASTIPALKERCGQAALYCDPEDVGSLTIAMLTLLEDSALRRQLIAKGHEQAKTADWTTCARETIDIIKENAAGSTASRHLSGGNQAKAA